MADDSGGKNFGSFGSSADMGDTLSTKDADLLTKALKQQTQQFRDNERALESWGRTSERARKEQEKWSEILKQDAKAVKEWSKQLFSVKGQYDDIKRSVGGFANELQRLGSISAVYNRKLDAMRKGQETFTKTLIATTGDTGRAMEKSQQYVNAVHDSYASANLMAGKYRVESTLLKKATDDLNARFATQIAVSGNMTRAIEGMREEAFILGRYLGMEMTEVMDAWQHRMQQSTMTLDESRKEMVAVAYQTDRYAKELAKLGDRFLKTANIGKREFIQMVQDVGKEMRTGILDATAYSKALGNLMIESKKSGYTVQEQMGVADAMKNLMAGMSQMTGPAGVFGARAAQGVLGDLESGKFRFRDEATQQRATRIIQDPATKPIQKMMALMEATQGSADFMALSTKHLREATEGSPALLQQVLTEFTGGKQWLAIQVREQIESRKLEEDFMAQSEKEAQESTEGTEKQTQVWKKSLEELVEASATPTDLDYKMIAQVEEIKGRLNHLIERFPIWLAAIQIGGSLLNFGLKKLGQRLLGGAAKKALLSGGAKVASTVAQSGATVPGFMPTSLAAGSSTPAAAGLGSKVAAIGSRALPMIGKLGVLGATFAASYYGSKALDEAAVKLVEGGEGALKGTYDSYTDYLTSRIAYGKKTATMMDRMDWDEKEKRLKLHNQLEEEIRIGDRRRGLLTFTEQEELKRKKRLYEENKEALGERAHRRNRASAEARFEGEQRRRQIILDRLSKIDIDATDEKGFVEKLLFGDIEGAKSLQQTSFGIMSDLTPQSVAEVLKSLPEHVRSQIGGDTDAIFKAVQEASMRKEIERDYRGKGGEGFTRFKGRIAAMSPEELEATHKKRIGKTLGEMGPDNEFSKISRLMYRDPAAAVRSLLGDTLGIYDEGAGQDKMSVSNAISPNARGDMVFNIPLRINASQLNNSLAKQKTRDTNG